MSANECARPLRRSSAHAATWNGTVALFVAVQHSWSAARWGPACTQVTHKEKRARLSQTPCCCYYYLLWDTVEYVCMYTPHNARNSYLLILRMQTWRRGPAHTPGIILPQSWDVQAQTRRHADRIASSSNQHLKH